MLPIEPVLPEIRAALRRRTEAVLEAPPGAGKTTLVPPALLDEDWLAAKRIVMLEPRRLAARAAAAHMARLRGEKTGATIGYRVRMDSRVGPETRVEVVTEGILTRMLQDDPSLEGVGLLIFDEFHERNLQADLGLALAVDARRIFRPDLRILVMSATLDAGRIASLLGDAPVIRSEGRSFPVETRYLARPPEVRIEALAARTVRQALNEFEGGDILVFLPGAGEIRRAAAQLENLDDFRVDVHALYGNLPPQAQDEAIAPAPHGRRKIVLATDIAESSLTIEGIRIVIDSGLARVPRFSPRSGMTRLDTVRVSRASADQRRGRAGRLGPGVCYRLWTELEQEHLEPHGVPEILQADLAPLALELALWGTANPRDLSWLDAPPSGALEQARDLLRRLGALDGKNRVTEHGRKLARLGMHPRLGHMVLRARSLGLSGLGCEIAAVLGERDLLTSREGVADADLRVRIQLLRRTERTDDLRYVQGIQVNRRALAHVRRIAEHWKRRLGARESGDIEATGLLLAFAYPDRIAQRRGERFRLSNGRYAVFSEPQLLSDAEFLVVADLGERRFESRIFMAAPISREDLDTHFADRIDDVSMVTWDADAGVVRARRQRRLGALILSDSPLRDPDSEAVVGALLEGIREAELRLLPWTKEARHLQDRLVFLNRRDPSWPDATDAGLLQSMETWLKPHLYGIKRAEELQRLALPQILLTWIGWDRREELDERAPTHVMVPSGSRIRIDYRDPERPVLAVRLQELFGATDTPRIDRGTLPLTLHLLSPAHRPMQVTQDLASFWRETYFDVRKDLRGRYPKHYWPENPLEAEPTSRTRRSS